MEHARKRQGRQGVGRAPAGSHSVLRVLDLLFAHADGACKLRTSECPGARAVVEMLDVRRHHDGSLADDAQAPLFGKSAPCDNREIEGPEGAK